jgi:hypothetical protein
MSAVKKAGRYGRTIPQLNNYPLVQHLPIPQKTYLLYNICFYLFIIQQSNGA